MKIRYTAFDQWFQSTLGTVGSKVGKHHNTGEPYQKFNLWGVANFCNESETDNIRNETD